jgi:hypothetical protein
MTKRQVVIPPDVVATLLDAAGPELVLVGGQSLAVWMDRYGVSMPEGFEYVSKDVDFLAASAADRESVRRLAKALGGHSVFPLQRAALTSLVGQAVKDVAEDEVFNVDVLHKMWGAKDDVRARSLVVGEAPHAYRVLHPLDVLKSRLDNLYGLKEKQNELGMAQLRAAIEVAQGFQREAAAVEKAARAKRPTTLRYVAFIEKLATDDAGKKVATRYGIHVADAVEPAAVPTKEFREKRLPQLGKLMSAARRRELSLPA